MLHKAGTNEKSPVCGLCKHPFIAPGSDNLKPPPFCGVCTLLHAQADQGCETCRTIIDAIDNCGPIPIASTIPGAGSTTGIEDPKPEPEPKTKAKAAKKTKAKPEAKAEPEADEPVCLVIDGSRAVCGQSSILVTSDPADVTCAKCKKITTHADEKAKVKKAAKKAKK